MNCTGIMFDDASLQDAQSVEDVQPRYGKYE